MIVYLLVLDVISGGIAAIIAQGKGRSAETFFLWAILFGPLGIVYAVFAASGSEVEGSYSRSGKRAKAPF